jgi:hypothetical protein
LASGSLSRPVAWRLAADDRGSAGVRFVERGDRGGGLRADGGGPKALRLGGGVSTDTAPATKQRNFRFPLEVSERLDELAAQLDVNAVDLVLEGVARVLAKPGGLRNVAKAKPVKRKRHRRSEEAPGRAIAPASTPSASPRAAEPRLANGQPIPAGSNAQPSTVHLPTVLRTWTGLPAAIMRAEIARGMVAIDGQVCRDLDVPGPVDRERVRWNGRPV